MVRAPFQILVFPFRSLHEAAYEYALFKRADAGYWQGIAGGGEDDESPAEAARREAREEAGISTFAPFYQLDSVAYVPIEAFTDHGQWDDQLLVIPEYCFAVEFAGPLLVSSEHEEIRWFQYEDCQKLLHWDSNKTALWELNKRLGTGRLPNPCCQIRKNSMGK